MTRICTFLVVGAIALAASSVASEATPAVPGPGLSAGPNAPIIEVDSRCGHHAHYVGRHRDHDGHWIRGRCVADHH
jgi:hypothetical protein